MNENIVSPVVATISLAIAIILLILIFSYSYLLIETFSEKEVLTKELIKTRLELEAEKETRGLVQQDKEQLTQQVQFLSSQLQQQIPAKPCPVCDMADDSSASVCQANNKDINMNLIRQALQQTISLRANDRFEGFFTLMNSIDYLTDQQQRELIEFYLKQMKPTNQEGVYFAVFIMSQLKPARLQEYEMAIEEKYRFIYFQPGWERISYRYCQIESKLSSYFH